MVQLVVAVKGLIYGVRGWIAAGKNGVGGKGVVHGLDGCGLVSARGVGGR